MPSRNHLRMTAHFRTWGGHFAYVVKSHIKNAVKSIIRAIFAYTAFTPFRVGMGELTSFLWRNGGQITAYRWYRQRAEKSYFSCHSGSHRYRHIATKKSLSLSAQKDGLTTSRYAVILKIEKGRVAGRRLCPQSLIMKMTACLRHRAVILHM